MRELIKPPQIDGDENATEMMRVWLAHNDLHVSLLLGMWADAEDCEIDECEAWGELMADSMQHVANGLSESLGISKQEIISKISQSFLSHLKSPEGDIRGGSES